MKVEIRRSEKKELSFPRLMQCTVSERIILITSPNHTGKHYTGTVIQSTDSDEIGYSSEFWVSDILESFEGSITLSN